MAETAIHVSLCVLGTLNFAIGVVGLLWAVRAERAWTAVMREAKSRSGRRS